MNRRFSARRIGAVMRKELREYRRNRSVLVATAIFPLIFLIQPVIVLLSIPASTAAELSNRHVLLYMLAVPVLTPAVLAAYSVAGERQQGSLEPVLTTPIREREFLLGKGLAALLPSLVIAYLVFGAFLGILEALTEPALASALLRPDDLLAQLILTPLLAAASVWIAVAISTRMSDARVAQQLSLLASLPLAILTTLLAFDVIHPTRGLLDTIGVVLFVVDVLGWRLVSPLFNRERLITGT